MDDQGLRDYGLPHDFEPTGVPKAESVKLGERINLSPKAKNGPALAQIDPCPNCGCCQLMLITLDMESPTAGKALCRYIGCPACPWASPAAMTLTEESNKNKA